MKPLHSLSLVGVREARSSTVALFLAATVCAGVTSRAASDWPQWRGPHRDAKATDFKAPKTWPKTLTQKWKVTVGEGVATPALVGGKLYVFSREDGNEVTRCLDATTGKELWQEKYESLGATGPAQSFAGPRSSPAVADGKVVTLGVRGMISCLDATDGKKLWRKDDFQAYPQFFPSSSPLIVDGMCIAQLGGRENGALVAYDLASGEEKWKWSGESPGYASPVLMTIDGAKIVVAETDRRIVGVHAKDGKVAFEIPYAVQGRGYNASTPIVDGKTLIYAGSNRGTKAAKIEKQGDGFVVQELWSNPDKSVQFNTPVLKDGFLYGLTASNEFFCINARNGMLAWSAPAAKPAEAAPAAGSGAPAAAAEGGDANRRPGGSPDGNRGGGRRRGGGGGGFGSIIDAGSVLLALTPASELIAFQPTEKGYQELARIKVAESPTHAYPVLSGNRLFIKDKDSVTLSTIE
ncbi:MAG TPA: PQQ-binding-like beta-propeller repeat protein [Chthoniobacteraceae bacterium]|nr:PQQ-binding-like beta-propeller repeat protein [Chthoniobacteraceae bacterium]